MTVSDPLGGPKGHKIPEEAVSAHKKMSSTAEINGGGTFRAVQMMGF